MGFFSNLIRKQGESLFFKSCKYGDEAQVKLMLDRNPELATKTDNNGRSGLMYASSCSHNRVVSLLLNVSAETVNLLEPFKEGSPLLYATLEGNIAIVRQLLEHGARPSLADSRGVTPLHVAVDNKYVDIVYMLISTGANPFARDNYGNTPHSLMERCGNPKIQELFSDINTQLDS